MTLLVWRDCSRCHKSYDGVYAGWFGCRACGHVERRSDNISDLLAPLHVRYVSKDRHAVDRPAVGIRRMILNPPMARV